MEDQYKEFAKNYDLFGDITEIDQNEKDFYSKLFNIYNVHNVLDCACGTGHHCYMFHKMGYEVEGSDMSEAMLEHAKANFNRVGAEINLTQGDFRDLSKHFNKKYDAVVCLTTSLPHLHEDADLKKALISMKSVLKDNGIMVITQGTTHNSLKPDLRIEVPVNNIDFSRVFVKDINAGILTINILDIFHNEIESKTQQFKVTYRILLDKDYRNLLQEAGFKNIKVFGGYDMQPYDEKKSWRLIVVGEK